MKLTKQEAAEFARAYINPKGSDSNLNKRVAEGFVLNMSQMMDNLYNSLQNRQELKDNHVNKPRLGG